MEIRTHIVITELLRCTCRTTALHRGSVIVLLVLQYKLQENAREYLIYSIFCRYTIMAHSRRARSSQNHHYLFKHLHDTTTTEIPLTGAAAPAQYIHHNPTVDTESWGSVLLLCCTETRIHNFINPFRPFSSFSCTLWTLSRARSSRSVLPPNSCRCVLQD